MTVKHSSLHEEVQKAMRELELQEKLNKERESQCVELIDLSRNIVSGWNKLTDEQKKIIQDRVNKFIEENEKKTQSKE